MKDTHKYGLGGLALGTLVVGPVLGFWLLGWTTDGNAKLRASQAVEETLVAVCARDMLANPESVALLKTKQPRDYDDAVRDSWKPKGFKAPEGFLFRQKCGREIESLMKMTAQKT